MRERAYVKQKDRNFVDKTAWEGIFLVRSAPYGERALKNALPGSFSTKFGAPKATTFEHIYIISYWFLENRNCANFRLPKISATDRAKQIREACYVY